MELRKAANHPLLIRDYYTDDMLSTMAQNYCKVLLVNEGILNNPHTCIVCLPVNYDKTASALIL